MNPQIIGTICTALVVLLAALCFIWHCRNFTTPNRDLFDAAREDWKRCVDFVAYPLCAVYALYLAVCDAIEGAVA